MKVAAVILAIILPALCAGVSPAQAPPPVPDRLREVYVPYAEFRARLQADPRGVVMSLAEYRALVEKALRASSPAEAPPLPPVDAVVASASYTGEAGGKSARFRAALKVRVAR